MTNRTLALLLAAASVLGVTAISRSAAAQAPAAGTATWIEAGKTVRLPTEMSLAAVYDFDLPEKALMGEVRARKMAENVAGLGVPADRSHVTWQDE